MTPDEIKMVQDSFAKVIPIKEQAAELFYGRLFETTPEVRPLFKGDMKEQGAKLMATLAVVVKGLNNIESLLPVAGDLAKRHVGYGVGPEHYPPVGAALIWTLGQGLGDEFTPEVEAAWAGAYGLLSGAMISAAYADNA